MKPAPFTYVRARDLGSAVERMGKAEGFAKYLAGGQTLGPMINLRLTQPDLLIDVSGVAELRHVEERPGAVRIGAATRHAEIEDRKVPDPSGGLMPRAARTLAYRAVRNRGTLGGSLAYGDPTTDWPTVVTALGAELELHGASGRRLVPIDDFLIGYLTTALEPDEILTAVTIPRVAPGSRVAFRKFSRLAGEFAQSLVAAVIDGPRSRVVLGCAAGKPVRLPTVSDLAGSLMGWRDGLEREIRRAAAQDFADLGLELDDYDANLHAATVARALQDAFRS